MNLERGQEWGVQGSERSPRCSGRRLRSPRVRVSDPKLKVESKVFDEEASERQWLSHMQGVAEIEG